MSLQQKQNHQTLWLYWKRKLLPDSDSTCLSDANTSHYLHENLYENMYENSDLQMQSKSTSCYLPHSDSTRLPGSNTSYLRLLTREKILSDEMPDRIFLCFIEFLGFKREASFMDGH